MNLSSSRKRLITVGIAAGAFLGSAGLVSAIGKPSATTPTAVTDTVAPAAAPAAGTDTSNSDPTHEAGESADREAAETAGGGFGHKDGGHSNTDPAHEASESPARQAEEAARDATNAGSSTNATPTTVGG